MKGIVIISALSISIALASVPTSSATAQAGAAPGQLQDSELQATVGAAEGQLEGAQAFAIEPSITNTQLTFRSHQLNAGASLGNLEGNACPANFKMISGSCHPGYTDQVIIINQYPNSLANTWRCGFSNISSSNRTVWIYTLCGQ
jgi:hypothetical protein